MRRAWPRQGSNADPATPSTQTVAAAVVPPNEAADPAARPHLTPRTDPTEAPTETPTPEPTPTETPLPTLTPTPDVTFDVTDYLMARGLPGLALLDIVGTLDEGTLVLTGTVTTVDQQRVLLDALKENPNVAVIDTTSLRLDIPATYTVVAGDSLWIISNKIYGDSTYMDDIFLLNRDILPSPEVLVVGSELKLPPLREEE
ncbi:MAG: LysM domain-containing protein [Caldilineaceae bacterium]